MLLAICACLCAGGCQCEDASASGWEFEESADAEDAGLVDGADGWTIPDGDAALADADAALDDALDDADTPLDDVADSTTPTEDMCEGRGPECLANCGGRLPVSSLITPEAGDTDRSRLVVDETGCPHIGYFQEGDSFDEFQVKYARWDGEVWHSEIIATTTSYDWLVDLALDDQGHPTMVYVEGERRTLIYARRDEAGVWHTEPIASLPRMRNLRYQRDPSDRASIFALHHGASGNETTLTFLEQHDLGWTRQDVVIISHASPSSLDTRAVFDAEGQPHMVMSAGGSTDSIFYVRRLETGQADDDSWAVERLEHDEGVGQAGLALDRDDRPHIVGCHWRSAPSVTYRWRSPSGWQQEPIEAVDTEAWGCGAVAFDPAGRLHTLYGMEDRAPEMDLSHAVRAASGWAVESLGDVVRVDIEFAIDPEREIAHVIAMKPISSQQPSATGRVTSYFHFPID